MIIVIKQADGSISQTSCAEGVDVAAHAKLLANGQPYHLIPFADMPTERTFQDAWTVDTNGAISTDLPRAKIIAHDARRVERDALYAPLDRQATVPALLTTAEKARAAIRTNDAAKQVAIDAAKTEAELVAAHRLAL